MNQKIPKNISEAIKTLHFKNGLIPTVIQDRKSKAVLMVAYMNREALEKTVETGETHFFSRSRKKLWHKGETSGHFQKVRKITADCDRDTLLIQVDQIGAACHTNKPSCFFEPVMQTLYDTIVQRKQSPSPDSYTSQLFEGGADAILKKIGEEAGELIISAKNKKKKPILHETADLLYHLWVMLCYCGITPEEVDAELYRRTHQSGLAEKRSRPAHTKEVRR